MTKHYCDICGKEVNPDEINARTFEVTYKGVKIVRSTIYADDRSWLMCDDCYKHFESYMKTRIDYFKYTEGDTNEH